MTNTHINFGGNKITTNKVGELKHPTINTNAFNTTSESDVLYTVTNGMCTVYISRLTPKASGDPLVISYNIPKAKMYCAALAFSSGTTVSGYLNVYGTNLNYGTPNTDMFWGTIIYPVADDWVEN